jgi:hypothetical protein
MAAVHNATMTFARRLSHCETIPQQDSAQQAFTKLARTFTAQVEALKRYRSKGTQHVIFERVNVEPGGQAIVGNVAHGGQGGGKADINPLQRAKRCTAHSKRSGVPCGSPEVKGRVVCRMHGAGGGAPEGKRNGNYCNGGRTKRAMAALAAVQAMARICRQTINALPD